MLSMSLEALSMTRHTSGTPAFVLSVHCLCVMVGGCRGRLRRRVRVPKQSA